MQSFLQNTVGEGSLIRVVFRAAEKYPPKKTLRFSPGDGGSFLAELQQAIEDDKVTL